MTRDERIANARARGWIDLGSSRGFELYNAWYRDCRARGVPFAVVSGRGRWRRVQMDLITTPRVRDFGTARTLRALFDDDRLRRLAEEHRRRVLASRARTGGRSIFCGGGEVAYFAFVDSTRTDELVRELMAAIAYPRLIDPSSQREALPV